MSIAKKESQASADEGRNRLAIWATAAGLFVEWFDLMVFSHLSPIIAQLFFPQASKSVALLQTYVVFALGFLIRPIGGILIGRWGDLHGRKLILFYSVMLMSVPMLLTAVLPTYREIGIAAPILLSVGRLLTGFSAGGEWTGTLVAILETTGSRKRSVSASLGNMSSGLGALASSLVVSVLSLLLSAQEMLRWGWRLPFFIGGILALMTLGLRHYMQETPDFEALRRSGTVSRQPLMESLRFDRRGLTYCLVLFGCGSLTYYLLITFLPGYLAQSGHMSVRQTTVFTTIVTAALAVGPLCFGLVADRIGSRRLLKISLLAMLLSVWPLFVSIALHRGIVVWISCAAFLAAKTAYTGSMLPIAAQSLPPARRFTGLSLAYNTATLLFGGTAPAVCTALIVVLGRYAAAAYVCFIVLVTAAAVRKLGDLFPSTS